MKVDVAEGKLKLYIRNDGWYDMVNVNVKEANGLEHIVRREM